KKYPQQPDSPLDFGHGFFLDDNNSAVYYGCASSGIECAFLFYWSMVLCPSYYLKVAGSDFFIVDFLCTDKYYRGIKIIFQKHLIDFTAFLGVCKYFPSGVSV